MILSETWKKTLKVLSTTFKTNTRTFRTPAHPNSTKSRLKLSLRNSQICHKSKIKLIWSELKLKTRRSTSKNSSKSSNNDWKNSRRSKNSTKTRLSKARQLINSWFKNSKSQVNKHRDRSAVVRLKSKQCRKSARDSKRYRLISIWGTQIREISQTLNLIRQGMRMTCRARLTKAHPT